MVSDINVLRVLMDKQQFTSHYNQSLIDISEQHTVAMLAWFKSYFKNYPEHERVNIDNLASLIKLKANQNPEQQALTDVILKQLKVPISPEVKAVTLNVLDERKLSRAAALLCKRFDDGDEVDIVFELSKLATEVKQRIAVQTQAAWCDTDVWELIQRDADDSGYIFDFLPSDIKDNIKGVNEGNNICVAAPTDKGKSSFLIRCAVSFAKQRLKRMATDTAMRFRPVLYLINEGMAEVLTPRVYQTALNIDRLEMWQRGSKGTITKDFEAELGRRDAIRLVNIHGMSVAQVARLIEAHDPFLVISDMTGRIKCNSGGKGANDVAQLEEVWNDMRMLAAMLDFIHIGTAQVSAEGFDNLYPPLSALQNSKTGIQTTLDLGIWIGAYASPMPAQENERGISTPKNKLARSGKKSYNSTLTYFNPELNDWDAVA